MHAQMRAHTLVCLPVNYTLLFETCHYFFHGRGIGHMQTMQAFKTVCPLRNELHLEIATVVKVKH